MDTKTLQRLAIASLVVAKILGIVGLILGFVGHRSVGVALLIADGVLLLVAVVLALVAARLERTGAKTSAVAKDGEVEDKEALARMARDGTLAKYLSDLELASDGAPKSSS